ncbi:MAG: cysteine--tRNA ligase [Candidatus Omnitrophica bacterium]|nr:cysteine--tRNA ligase [Candidatus Omnitrophota bacterium]
MPIFIYNSLTRKKEEFFPLKPPQVNIYTCGVTVYDESHIGHARSLYVFDLIRRYLKYRGFKVKFVRNITDIDDKIIKRANELKVGWKELIRKYIERYYEDLEALGIEKGDSEPRATENIPDMVRYIQNLIDKGYAYPAGGDVYFNVRKFSDYGKLSGQGINQMETGVRIEPTELKRDPLDFALWKASKENEPFWDSPWGKGRPGWHIECSVMSQKYLDTDTLDIHAGGRDLIFPHHENETAQSEAATGKPFAKYWIHHGLLTINGQKMSKSLGNFVTIKDFIAEYQDTDLLKLFFLSTHYSHPIDYTEEKIEEARKQKIIIDSFFEKIYSWGVDKFGIWRWQKSLEKIASSDKNNIDNIYFNFKKVMDDDFNTPQGLSNLFELIDLCSKFISADKKTTFDYARSKIEWFLKVLGLAAPSQEKLMSKISTKRHKKKLSEMKKARQTKDYEKSDRIRKEFEADGLVVSNTASTVSITTTFAKPIPKKQGDVEDSKL